MATKTCRQADGTCDRKSLSGFPVCRRCLDQCKTLIYDNERKITSILLKGVDLNITLLVKTTKEITHHDFTYRDSKLSMQPAWKTNQILHGVRTANQRIRDPTKEEIALLPLLIK